MLQAMFLDLASRLKKHTGKKLYSYLKFTDKKLVDGIVDEIEKIPAVKELYDFWYEKQEELASIYKTVMPERIPLSQNPDFKTMRNAVIKAASEFEILTGYEQDEDIVGIGIEDELTGVKTQDLAFCTPEMPVNTQHIAGYHSADRMYVGAAVSRLLNNVGKILRGKFADNPKHSEQVDRKLRMKILEKDQAHGIRHG